MGGQTQLLRTTEQHAHTAREQAAGIDEISGSELGAIALQRCNVEAREQRGSRSAGISVRYCQPWPGSTRESHAKPKQHDTKSSCRTSPTATMR